MTANKMALDALTAARKWLNGWASAEAEIAQLDAAIAALQAEPQPSAQGPEEIFLQLHGNCLPDEATKPVDYTDDSVTWCWHRIHDSDVRYIRADLAALPATPPKD